MLFNSLSFILVFLPLCLVFYYVAAQFSGRCAAAVLVAFSLFFYSWWNPAFLILLCGSIAFNYSFGLLILRSMGRRRLQNAILSLAVCGNLFLLFYYKYLYPLMAWLDTIGLHIARQDSSVILPLGISFFTFTQIGYLLDCKAGLVKGGSLLNYILFVTFFPHLIAGPILHHREMLPQFSDPKTYQFKAENFAVGMAVFIMGFFKKIVLADHFMPLANTAFSHPDRLGMAASWGGALSNTLQIYFDFSGYSEMAVGLALLFGIRLPANFNSPYKAHSIIDYWQRWNMTLTRYLTLYLYNPVALWATRRRAAKGKTIGRQAASHWDGFLSMIALPTFYTMILAGIWHGAGWQFLVLGLLHALYLTVNNAWRIFMPKPQKKHFIISGFETLWKVSLTMLAVVISQVFFRAESLPDACILLQNMFGFGGVFAANETAGQPDAIEDILIRKGHDLIVQYGFDPLPWLKHIQFGAPLTVLLGFIWIFTMPNVLQLTAAYQPTLSKIPAGIGQRMAWHPNLLWACILGVMAAIAMLAITGTTPFVYFQF